LRLLQPKSKVDLGTSSQILKFKVWHKQGYGDHQILSMHPRRLVTSSRRLDESSLRKALLLTDFCSGVDEPLHSTIVKWISAILEINADFPLKGRPTPQILDQRPMRNVVAIPIPRPQHEHASL
jgi:hypothetical protein